jgi:hypothetical protein
VTANLRKVKMAQRSSVARRGRFPFGTSSRLSKHFGLIRRASWGVEVRGET